MTDVRVVDQFEIRNDDQGRFGLIRDKGKVRYDVRCRCMMYDVRLT